MRGGLRTSGSGGYAEGQGRAAPAVGGIALVFGIPAGRMLGDDEDYRFEPAAATIRAGDAVRWTNGSGGPHHVTFRADRVPAGARARLGADVPDTGASPTTPARRTPR